MSNDEILTDGYVAEMLAKDAKDCSLKYSALGLEAFRQTKKPANLPKPNTRFLRHIIKDTNSHNAALLAKEKAESRTRLRDMEREEEKKRRRQNARPRDIRRRQMGDINAILGGKRNRRGDGQCDTHDPGLPRKRHGLADSGSDGGDGSSRKIGDRRRDASPKARDGQRRKNATLRETASPQDRHRSRSPVEWQGRHRDRSPVARGPAQTKSLSRMPGDKQRHRQHDEFYESSRTTREATDEESDPLDDFIGPAPPPKSQVVTKGRGALSTLSGIDRRFAESYDPKADIQLGDDEHDAWAEALEAARDRQKLLQNQEARMRAAGFSDQDLSRWKDGDQRSEDSVRWGRLGEEREWDLGKQQKGGGTIPGQ